MEVVDDAWGLEDRGGLVVREESLGVELYVRGGICAQRGRQERGEFGRSIYAHTTSVPSCKAPCIIRCEGWGREGGEERREATSKG